MLYNRSHVGGLSEEGREKGQKRGQRRGQSGGRDQSLGNKSGERERGRGGESEDVGSGQGQPFTRECSECAQGVLLGVAVEDVPCLIAKVWPVQMPEH